MCERNASRLFTHVILFLVSPLCHQQKNAPNPSMFTQFFFFFFWSQSNFIALSQTVGILCFRVFYRPLVPQLAPPKIPEGERVDFDVSYGSQFCVCHFVTASKNTA